MMIEEAENSSQHEMTAEELRRAARAGELIGAMTPGAPLGVIAPEGLPRATKLIGREDALERALASLANASTAAIAISGPPGVGKTAFAAEIVARAGERGLFPGGVVWVACEGQSGDAGLEMTLRRLARAISAADEGAASLEQLQAALHDALQTDESAPRLLLALDSVEPTMDVSALLDTLAGGRAALLLTTRHPLHDDRAQDETLPPLDPTSATELFRQRLHQNDPGRPTAEDEPLIAGAVAALGETPLAIDLAASLAAITRLPLDQITPDGNMEKPRGMAANRLALLDRAWEALPATPRLLLAGLALVDGATFPRGVALAVAGAARRLRSGVASDEENASISEAWREEAAATLDALIGLRLVDALATGRLRLHPLIRRYATARLREAPEETRDALGAAMAGWWLDYARAHSGRDGGAALEAEAAGIMGAITWAHARERYYILLDLSQAVDYAWRVSGRIEDLRHVLPWAVAAARALNDSPRLLAALLTLARFDARAGRVTEARASFTEVLRLARELGDEQAATMAQRALSELEPEP
jgi:DNA polymerase III delta prime subunit